MIENKFEDIMLDVETVGLDGKFLVLSIALVPFNINTGEIGEAHQFNIDFDESIELGFKPNAETLKWWVKNNHDLFLSFFENTTSIYSVVYDLKDIFKADYKRCWASAVIDYQAVSNITESVIMENPITYDKRLCTRTVRSLHDSKFPPITINNNHDPIKDCENQIKVLVEQLKNLGIKY